MARGVDLSPLQAAETFTGERMRSHRGRPPALLQTSLLRTGGRHGLVRVDTNRDSVPGVYIRQCLEVPWGPVETVPCYHQRTIMAGLSRQSGQHELASGDIRPQRCERNACRMSDIRRGHHHIRYPKRDGLCRQHHIAV
jgi:hypothetical protein